MTTKTLPVTATGANMESENFDLGIAYWAGPFGVGLLWGHGEYEQQDGTEDEFNQIALNGTYILGPGIDVEAQIDWGELDDGSVVKTEDNDWVSFLLGTAITF